MWDRAADALRRWAILAIGLVYQITASRSMPLTAADGFKHQTAASEKPGIESRHQMAHNDTLKPLFRKARANHLGRSRRPGTNEAPKAASSEKTPSAQTSASSRSVRPSAAGCAHGSADDKQPGTAPWNAPNCLQRAITGDATSPDVSSLEVPPRPVR